MYDNTGHHTFTIPGLATVTIDPEDDGLPTVEIVLADDYSGDLNDLEKRNGLPPRVFFRGYHTDAINSPDLCRFMETLHLWDYNSDGVYDGDHVIEMIEKAFWQQRVSVDELSRPNGGVYTDLLMQVMPPQPERHIVFSYGNLKPRFELKHYLLAIPTMAVIIALINLQEWLMPWSKYSVISGFGVLVDSFGFVKVLLAITAAYVVLRRIVPDDRTSTKKTLSKHTYGFFNKAAVYEEQAFREGAEKWSTRERATSCLVFGAIHMVNLFYPLATIVPLAIGGAMFMWVYLQTYRQTGLRRQAVLASSVVHRVYNRLALFIVVVFIFTTITKVIVGTVLFAMVLGILYAASFVASNCRQLIPAFSRPMGG